MTTTTITHATPGACYAHTPDRNWEGDANLPAAAREAGFPDIARQLVEFAHGDGIEEALGLAERPEIRFDLGGTVAGVFHRGFEREACNHWLVVNPYRPFNETSEATLEMAEKIAAIR